MHLHRNFLSLALAAGVLGLASCNKGGDFAKTKTGIEYKIFKNDGGTKYSSREVGADGDATYKTRMGKILALDVEYRSYKDSVLFNSRKQQGIPMRIELMELKTKGGLEEALAMLQPGDSGVFRFNVDTIFAKSFRQPVPPFMKPAVAKNAKPAATPVYMTMFVKAQKLQSKEEAQADQQKMMAEQQQKMAAHAEDQLKKDDVILQQYVKKNNLTMQKDASGVYYMVTKPGTGPKPKAGQTVSVLYKGSLLDGKVFDSSEKVGNKPIDFPIGVGQVIPGWDKAIPLLAKGSKATLLIPSSLAYGQRGAGADIPADAPLRFDVELVDVK